VTPTLHVFGAGSISLVVAFSAFHSKAKADNTYIAPQAATTAA